LLNYIATHDAVALHEYTSLYVFMGRCGSMKGIRERGFLFVICD